MTNLEIVLEKIEKKRLQVNEHKIIKLVAVSKYSNSDDIVNLYKEGQRAFGENRVQELKLKVDDLSDYPIEWHFQGVLQKNKINQLLSLNPFLIHSIESYDMAKEVDKRATKKVSVLLQINSSFEKSKSGIDPQMAVEEYLKIKEECINLQLKGVMSIGAHSDDKNEIKKSFERTYKIFEALNSHEATICSMGMSSDYELAIECGSNMLRLGSVIFK